jgi:hypothetical protein
MGAISVWVNAIVTYASLTDTLRVIFCWFIFECRDEALISSKVLSTIEDYCMSILKIADLRFCEALIVTQPDVVGGFSLGVYRSRRSYNKSLSEGSKSGLKAAVPEQLTPPPVSESNVMTTGIVYTPDGGKFSATSGSLNTSGSLSIGSSVY